MYCISFIYISFFTDQIRTEWTLPSTGQQTNFLVIEKQIDYHLLNFKKPKEESVKAFKVLNEALLKQSQRQRHPP